MTERKSRARRYQARLSLDDKMGDLWEWFDALPDRTRASRLLFMVQLGFETHKALAGHAVAAIQGLGNAAGPSAPGATAQTHARSPVAESSDAAKQATLGLGGWNIDAFEDMDAIAKH